MSVSVKLIYGIFVGHDDSCADQLIDKLCPESPHQLESLLEGTGLHEVLGCCFDCCARYVAVKELTRTDYECGDGVHIALDPQIMHSLATVERRNEIIDFFRQFNLNVKPQWYVVGIND